MGIHVADRPLARRLALKQQASQPVRQPLDERRRVALRYQEPRAFAEESFAVRRLERLQVSPPALRERQALRDIDRIADALDRSGSRT